MLQKPIRTSGILKFVGFNREEEVELSKYFEEIFKTQPIDEVIAKSRREKSDKEKKMILEILEKMRHFIEKYGERYVEITSNNIHILDQPELANKESEEEGNYSAWEQSICTIDTGSDVKNAHNIVHEIIHFNSFQSIELVDRKDKKMGLRRVGFQVNSRRRKEYFFSGINEAITEELTIRFDNEHFESIGGISREVKRRNEIRNHMERNGKDVMLITDEKVDGHRIDFVSLGYAYKKERQKLEEIIEKIYQCNPEEFITREEVFAMFAINAMNGRLLKTARLIKKAYGEGSFKKLGEETKKKI